MMDSSLWRIDGDQGYSDALGLQIDLARPATGVHGIVDNASVLGVTTAQKVAEALRLEDAYVRGVDLVANYAATPNFPFRTEIYWRVESATPLRLTMIVSVETDLLDTQPELTVAGRIAGSKLQSDMQGFSDTLLASHGGRSWFEAVHPTDSAEAVGAFESDAWRWTLFSQFLEKGVIRRARLSGVRLNASEATPEAIQGLYDDFARAEPPLTA